MRHLPELVEHAPLLCRFKGANGIPSKFMRAKCGEEVTLARRRRCIASAQVGMQESALIDCDARRLLQLLEVEQALRNLLISRGRFVFDEVPLCACFLGGLQN